MMSASICHSLSLSPYVNIHRDYDPRTCFQICGIDGPGDDNDNDGAFWRQKCHHVTLPRSGTALSSSHPMCRLSPTDELNRDHITHTGSLSMFLIRASSRNLDYALACGAFHHHFTTTYHGL